MPLNRFEKARLVVVVAADVVHAVAVTAVIAAVMTVIVLQFAAALKDRAFAFAAVVAATVVCLLAFIAAAVARIVLLTAAPGLFGTTAHARVFAFAATRVTVVKEEHKTPPH